MYVYIKLGNSYQAGFYLTKYGHDGSPYNQFMTETGWPTAGEAAARVNYLNGGSGHPPWMAVPDTKVEKDADLGH
jgi:hypothetical protein|tara:strand:- start:202 stop:426 length:225 start_codon:yes stop_codon:yes gene_type:complete